MAEFYDDVYVTISIFKKKSGGYTASFLLKKSSPPFGDTEECETEDEALTMAKLWLERHLKVIETKAASDASGA